MEHKNILINILEELWDSRNGLNDKSNCIAHAQAQIEELYRQRVLEWVGSDRHRFGEDLVSDSYYDGWNDRGEEIRNRVEERVK